MHLMETVISNTLRGLLIFFTLFWGAFALAQLEGPLSGDPTDPKGFAKFSGSLYGDASTGDAAHALGLAQHGANFSAPVLKSPAEALSLSVNYNEIDSVTAAHLPNSGREIPAWLSSSNFGLTYARKTEGGKYWALNGSFGSASDRPFSNPNVDTLGMNWFYTTSVSEQATWLFIVNYSNNRPILNNIPLPGFAYVYMPSKTFRGVFGFPFAFFRWEFEPDYAWSFFVASFSVVKTELSYSIKGPVQLFTSFDFSQQPFFMRDRDDTKSRLFYDEKKWALGVRSPLSSVLMAEISGGIAFDRNFFEAENYEKASQDRLSIGATWFAAANLSARF